MATFRRRGNIENSDDVSCPAGSQRWKCEDINYPVFIGCCSSNPCFSQICSSENLHPRELGSITTPVSRDLTATTSVRSTSSTSSSTTVAPSTSTNMAAVAGGAAAIGIVVTAFVGLAIYYCRRRRRARKFEPSMQNSTSSKYPGSDMGRTDTGSFTLPLYAVTSSPLLSPRIHSSPAPVYMPMAFEKTEPIEPQEIMGIGLTEEEYKRRFKSRTPVSALNGPVELATLRFSAADIYAEAEKPLLKPKAKPRQATERPSRLRNSPAIGDLRALAVSRSPSISPARSDDLG